MDRFDINKFISPTDPKNPVYQSDSDYNTNSPSYYQELARKQRLIELLAKRVWEYDQVLAAKLQELHDTMQDYMGQFDEKLEEWDKRLLAFDDEVERLLREWIDDGTFAHIINEEIFGFKLDTISFNQVVVNVKMYDVTGDGVTNDTLAIQTLLDNVSEYSTLYFPAGDYYFDQLQVRSNTKIIFDPNAKIKSDFLLDDATKGIISIEGKLIGSGYNVLEDIQALSRKIKLSASSAANLSHGDMIELSQDRAFEFDSGVTTYAEHEQQHGYAIMTIKSVNYSNGEIEFYEVIPYNFKVLFHVKASKVDPVQNVVIEGQNTEFDRMGNQFHGDYVRIAYGRNIKISGLHCRNGAGKSIGVHFSHHFELIDIKHGEITSKSVALGEGIIVTKSGFGLIDNCKIFDTKRGIDFANSWHSLVTNCVAYDARLTTHGLFSTHITFENCKVYADNLTDNQSAFTIGNMSYLSDEYINIIDCEIYGGRYGVHALTHSNNIKIDNLRTYGTDIVFAFNNFAHKIYISNSKSEGNRTFLSIDDVDELIIDNMIVRESRQTSDVGTMRVRNATHVKINRLDFKSDRIVFLSPPSDGNGSGIVEHIAIHNSQIDIGESGIRLMGIDINHFDLFNVTTNGLVRITGVHDVFVRNCVIPNWNNNGNTIEYNAIFKDNILTGVNGIEPEYPINNEAKSVIKTNNIYLM